MNDEKIVYELFEKIKDIEKDFSMNYIGKLTNNDLKKYQKDVVDEIKNELNKILKETGE